jgi:hypothetical protein
MINAHLDTSTTGHTLDAEFDLLGLVVERAAALCQGDALERVFALEGERGDLMALKTAERGVLRTSGKGIIQVCDFHLKDGKRTDW